MKKHFFLLSTLCALLTSCDNYTSSHQGQPGSGAAGQQRNANDASGRPTRDIQGPNSNAGQQPVGPASHVNPDTNRNPRDQGR